MKFCFCFLFTIDALCEETNVNGTMQLYNIEAVPVRAHIICSNQMDLCQPIESETDAVCSSNVRQGTSAMKLKTTAVAVSCGDHTLDLFA